MSLACRLCVTASVTWVWFLFGEVDGWQQNKTFHFPGSLYVRLYLSLEWTATKHRLRSRMKHNLSGVHVCFCGSQTNVALVSPLLRLENNHCHIEESEYVLKKAHKYSELIILYEKKGLHQKGEGVSA